MVHSMHESQNKQHKNLPTLYATLDELYQDARAICTSNFFSHPNNKSNFTPCSININLYSHGVTKVLLNHQNMQNWINHTNHSTIEARFTVTYSNYSTVRK